jgi:RNA polymerase sigma factor (sigma-70 family)
VRTDDGVDAELLARARGGDESAFRALHDRHRERLTSACRRWLPAEDAADVVQEAFARAWAHLDGFEERSAFYPWLHAIARNRAMDVLRARRARPVAGLEPAGVDELGAQLAEARDADAEVRTLVAALERLSPRHRRFLHLHEYEGWTYEQIADAHATELGTVKSVLWRARQSLRREYLLLVERGLVVVALVAGWIGATRRRWSGRLASIAAYVPTPGTEAFNLPGGVAAVAVTAIVVSGVGGATGPPAGAALLPPAPTSQAAAAAAARVVPTAATDAIPAVVTPTAPDTVAATTPEAAETASLVVPDPEEADAAEHHGNHPSTDDGSDRAKGQANGNGPATNNAGGNGNGRANGLNDGNGNANGPAGNHAGGNGQGNGNAGHSAGGNGSDAGQGNGGHSAGGHGNGPAESDAGGNGTGQVNGNGNGAAGSNAGGNGNGQANGNAGNSADGTGDGSADGNAGGNGAVGAGAQPQAGEPGAAAPSTGGDRSGPAPHGNGHGGHDGNGNAGGRKT